jgi:cathepsin K
MNKLIYTFVASILLIVCAPLLAQDKGTGLILSDPKAYLRIPQLPQATRGPLPASATLEQMFPEAGNQGNMGSCTAWAVTNAKAYRIFKASDRTGTPNSIRQSPAFVYSALTEKNCNSGTRISDALQFVMDVGSVNWFEMEYKDNECNDWEKAEPLAKNKSIESYRLSADPSIALQQMREAIADGNPIIMAINACTEFKEPKSVYIGTIVQDGSTCYAHAVLAVGYSDDLKSIRILNSWGLDWGGKKDGMVWMDYKVFSKRYLGQAYVDFGPEPNRTWNMRRSWANRSSQVTGQEVSAAAEIPKVSSADLVRSLRTHISPKSAGTAEIGGIKKPVSQWSIWLNLPKSEAAQIKSVEYYFYHPTFRNPKRSIKGSSIFLSQWLGHGCTHKAKVIAKLVDGSDVSSDFDYCEVLANSRASNTTIPIQRSDLSFPEAQTRTAFFSQPKGISVYQKR